MNIRIFLTAWLLFAAHAATNVVREHYPAFALVKHGTFQVDEYQGLHSDIFVHADGHSYINSNVATSLIASAPLLLFDPLLDYLEAKEKAALSNPDGGQAGVYRIDKPMRQSFFREVSRRGLSQRFGASTLITSVCLVAPLSALCVVVVYQFLLRRGVTRVRAVWLALVFAAGTPLFFRSANLTSNVFVMYFTLASFMLLQRLGDGSASIGRHVLAGFCAGAALACDYSGVVAIACLSGFMLLNQWPGGSIFAALRKCAFFVLGSIPPITFLLFSQWAMFGDPWRPAQYWMPSANYTDLGWRGFSVPSIETLFMNLMHPSYGLFIFGPILLLAIFPVPRHVTTGNVIFTRNARIFTATFAGLFLLFCAANQYSRMQWNTGVRYLMPLVPFLFLAACDRLARMSTWTLLAVSVPAVIHTWILCMARDCNPNNDTWREASTLGTWIAQLPIETVPASYVRIWHDGLQLPWLRVLQLTSPTNHPILGQVWLPYAVLAMCGVAIAAIWMVGPSSAKPVKTSECGFATKQASDPRRPVLRA